MYYICHMLYCAYTFLSVLHVCMCCVSLWYSIHIIFHVLSHLYETHICKKSRDADSPIPCATACCTAVLFMVYIIYIYICHTCMNILYLICNVLVRNVHVISCTSSISLCIYMWDFHVSWYTWYAMTHVWHDSCVTWLMCDMTHVWHDSCVTWLMCDMTQVWHDSCVTWLMCDMTHVWHDSWYVMCAMTHASWYPHRVYSFMCVSWRMCFAWGMPWRRQEGTRTVFEMRIQIHDMKHSRVCHDSFVCR